MPCQESPADDIEEAWGTDGNVASRAIVTIDNFRMQQGYIWVVGIQVIEGDVAVVLPQHPTPSPSPQKHEGRESNRYETLSLRDDGGEA